MTGTTHRVVVLGAGMSGICIGIKLREAGVEDFVILEKREAVGGTWRDNTYPGVACDVPSHVYSYSFELNPDWHHAYSEGAEIQRYCETCVTKYGLAPHLRFGAEATEVAYRDGRWHVTTRAGDRYAGDVLVSGLGGLHIPNPAAIDGKARFRGAMFHTAQWDHACDLTGRRVAIIGTGASAAQVLPSIAPSVADVTVFQRHAAWVFPRLAREIPEARRVLFRRFPWLMRLYRRALWLAMDVLGVLSLRRGGVFHRMMERESLAFLERSVTDPTTRRALTPTYAAGCKRRCIADDYWSTFNRANVHLVTDAIVGIEEDGVRDATGRLHAVDVIIEATGFKPFDIAEYVDIRGRDGLRLRDAFAARVESFRTIMVPGFPNFFMLLGPNSATGHTSALIMIESQARYVVKCLELMRREQLSSVEPRAEVTKAFNRRIQADMQKMVFSGGCSAWYTDDDDVNFTLWPYSALRFLAEMHEPRRDELAVTPVAAS